MNIISQIYCLNYLASLINSNILKLESDHYLVFKYHKKDYLMDSVKDGFMS